MMDGFLALYVFMLAAICGHVIISPRAGDPAHAADVRLQLRARHRAGRRDDRAGACAKRTLANAPSASSPCCWAPAMRSGGYVVTERMLEMFKSSKDKKARERCHPCRPVNANSEPNGCSKP
jgi:NAD(P) transhydrogenase subunit alpha